MTTPTLISVSNVSLPNTANSGAVAITAPTGANAYVVGGTYLPDNFDPSLDRVTSVSLSLAGSTTLLNPYTTTGVQEMPAYLAYGKLTGTGAGTITVVASRAYGEGPTCQIVWLTVDDPDNFVREARIKYGVTSVLTDSVSSSSTDLVVEYDLNSGDAFGTLSGWTVQGSAQSTNSDNGRVLTCNAPGASSTSASTSNVAYPAMALISLKGSAGAPAATDRAARSLALQSAVNFFGIGTRGQSWQNQ